jgi:ectoine hydroxylase-related dioxygenase (phytanoyl-CoA dioxygenase family)
MSRQLKTLTPEQYAIWEAHGYLVIPDFFSSDKVKTMRSWIDEIQNWPIAEGRHLNYYEVGEGEQRLSRTENFIPFHDGFQNMLEDARVYDAMADVIGEPVLLFKDKINYKHPGTGEYPPHQEVHAANTAPYAFQPYHKNMVVFVDDSDVANGCLELGHGFTPEEFLETLPSGTIKEEISSRLTWKPLEVKAGSVLIFNMFWPHRSSVNNSERSRRTLFLTFNGVSRGDLRQNHYEDRASGKPNTREIKDNLVVQTRLDIDE